MVVNWPDMEVSCRRLNGVPISILSEMLVSKHWHENDFHVQ